MLREQLMRFLVQIPKEDLDCSSRKVLTRDVTTRLLKDLADQKVWKYGYFLAVTKVISIGRIPDQECCPNLATFAIKFQVRMFLPVSGEVFTGRVYRITNNGVFLKSGPMNIVFLSLRKMPNYEFVNGKTPSFVGEDLSRVEIGVVVRYSVLAVKWAGDDLRAFKVLASIDGDGLGPVSTLCGLDELEF